ncbi:Hypothetical predicted protein, partial [Pelobates cultripes]
SQRKQTRTSSWETFTTGSDSDASSTSTTTRPFLGVPSTQEGATGDTPGKKRQAADSQRDPQKKPQGQG